MPSATIEMIGPDDFDAHLESLASVLRECVEAGASVNFILPFSQEEARDFWVRKVRPGLEAGRRDLFVARGRGGEVVGTVVLDRDMPPNGTHRGEIGKLLVLPAYRRSGIARALMARLGEEARSRTLRLLTLDTRLGDPASALYRSLGFEVAGSIPEFCRSPEGDQLQSTTYMYKLL